MADIQRRYDTPQEIYIQKWWTGIYTNRSPLFTPISAMGIQLIARQDTLWQGLNMQISPQYTLRRRYGFIPWSTAQYTNSGMGAIQTFFSFENLEGNVQVLVDGTNTVNVMNGTSFIQIWDKAPNAGQTSFQSVASTLYAVDGASAWKWVNGGVNWIQQSNTIGMTPWMASSSFSAPTFTLNDTTAPDGTQTATLVNFPSCSGGNFSYMKQNLSIGNVASQTCTFSIYLSASSTSFVSIRLLSNNSSGGGSIGQSTTCGVTTAWQRFTVTTTWSATNADNGAFIYFGTDNFAPLGCSVYAWGAQVEFNNVATVLDPTTTLINGSPINTEAMGIVAPTTSPTLAFGADGPLEPLIGYQYGYCFHNDITGHVSTMSPASANTGPLNNQTTVEGDTIPSTGPYTVTVLNQATFLADEGVVYAATNQPFTQVSSGPTVGQYSVSGGVYTFAAADAGADIDITYSFSLTISTGMTITVNGDCSTDTQVTDVWIFRTDDGGTQFYFLASVANTGSTWTYTDSSPDDDLNNELIAPIADANNPPPTGLSLLTWYAGRLWGASGNTLYYSGGPDTTLGVGEEAWPPINNFTVPGNITALLSTAAGLIVFTYDDAYAVTGSTSSTFTVPVLWQANYGVPSQNAVAQDGDNAFIFNTQNQIYNIQASASGGTVAAISFIIQDQLQNMIPNNIYLTVHRSGVDEGLFLSDGSTNLWRYSQVAQAWDPVSQPVGGVGAIMSLETSALTWRLMIASPNAGAGYSQVLARDLNTFTDNGTAYPAFATVGSLTVAPPRKVANLASVLTQFTAIGTYPTISVLLNEISDTGKFPATFVALPNPVPDPPQLPATQTIWTRRHDWKAAQAPLSGHVSHLQIKITFLSEAYPNEILGIGLA